MNEQDAEKTARAIIYAADAIARAIAEARGAPIRTGIYNEVLNTVMPILLGQPAPGARIGRGGGLDFDDDEHEPGAGETGDSDREGLPARFFADDDKHAGGEPEDDGPSLFGDDEPARDGLIERLFDDQAFREGYEAGNRNGAMGVWTMFSVLFPRYVKAGQNNPAAFMLRIAGEVEKLAGRTVYGEATRDHPE
jgi:hypothetical protein